MPAHSQGHLTKFPFAICPPNPDSIKVAAVGVLLWLPSRPNGRALAFLLTLISSGVTRSPYILLRPRAAMGAEAREKMLRCYNPQFAMELRQELLERFRIMS